MQRLDNKTVKALCWIDLILVTPLAIPPVAQLIISLFTAIDNALGLASPLPALNDMRYMFVSLTGILACVWSIARLREPTRLNIGLDAAARLAVTILLLYAWAKVGVSSLFILFLVTETVGAVLQFKVLRQTQPAQIAS